MVAFPHNEQAGGEVGSEDVTARNEPTGPGRRAPSDPVTLVGLVFETATGLKRMTTAPFEQRYALPPQSFDVLVRLARSPGGRLRMSDLAARSALTPSGLTRAIDRLEEAGLVCREACAEDRRGSFAGLTEAGRERMEAVMERHREHLEGLFSGALSSTERRQLARLLERLRDEVNPSAGRARSE